MSYVEENDRLRESITRLEARAERAEAERDRLRELHKGALAAWGQDVAIAVAERDRARDLAQHLEEDAAKPKWADLWGIDPDYTEGKSIAEFLDEGRGTA